jgi:hypothetical protein
MSNSQLQLNLQHVVERINSITCTIVALTGTVSAISGWISAYHSSLVAYSYADAAVSSQAFGHNSTMVAENLDHAITSSNSARHAASVQLMAETVTLIIVIFMFIIGGLLAFIRIKHANFLLANTCDSSTSMIAAATSGASVTQRIRRTVIVVFGAFLLRSVFDLLYAISLTANRSEAQDCAQSCAPCQATLYLISKFLDFCPYIQATVIFFSEPCSLLVALWGMTTPRMWHHFVSSVDTSNRQSQSFKMSI